MWIKVKVVFFIVNLGLVKTIISRLRSWAPTRTWASARAPSEAGWPPPPQPHRRCQTRGCPRCFRGGWCERSLAETLGRSALKSGLSFKVDTPFTQEVFITDPLIHSLANPRIWHRSSSCPWTRCSRCRCCHCLWWPSRVCFRISENMYVSGNVDRTRILSYSLSVVPQPLSHL